MNIEKLNILKTKGNYSYQKISDLSGIPLSTVTRIFRGEGSVTFDNVAAIVRAIGGDMNDLADLGQPHVSEDMAKVYEKTIELQEKHMAEKDHTIKILRRAVVDMVAVFIVIVFIDLANGSVGWARYQEAFNVGSMGHMIATISDFIGF